MSTWLFSREWVAPNTVPAFVRTLQANDYQQFNYLLLPGADWAPLPIGGLGTVAGLVLTTDALIDIRLYGQIDGTLEAAGTLALWLTDLETVTAPVVMVRNRGAAGATLQGIAIGTGLEAV